jgi:hypothetical protein
MDFERLRNEVYKHVKTSLNEKITDENLLHLYLNSESGSYAIRNISQDTRSKFYPLIANKEWEVRYSYFSHPDSMHYNFDNHAPMFLDVKIYQEWMELRKDKERFDKEWRHNRFWKMYGDSEMYDGRANIYLHNYHYLPDALDDQKKYQIRKKLKTDEIAIVFKVYAGRDYAMLSEWERDVVHRDGTVFVLAPKAKTIKERQMIVAKYFKNAIIADYADHLMGEYDKKIIETWSQRVLNCSLESKTWVHETTTEELYDMINHL